MIKKLNDMELLDDAVIGTGACSKVVRCRLKNSDKIYALKIVDMSRISQADGENLRNEIALHKELVHPHIVRYYDSIGEGDFIYFLLEYCAKNTLYFFVHVRQGLPDILALRFFYQVAQAIKFMHDRNIIHRDIKPENLLVDDDFNLKVCDLGWACKLNNERPRRKSIAGTFEYMAPEVIYEHGHGKEFDVWTLGILLYEMLHGTSPYSADSHIEMQREFDQRKITYSNKISKPVQDLMNGMLERDPAKRLTIDQVLNHPVIQQNLGEFKRPLNEKELEILNHNNYLNQVNARRVTATMINGVKVEPKAVAQQQGPLPGTEAIPRTNAGAEARKPGFADKNIHQVFNPERPADLEKLSQYTMQQDIKSTHVLSSNQSSALSSGRVVVQAPQNGTSYAPKPASYTSIPQTTSYSTTQQYTSTPIQTVHSTPAQTTYSTQPVQYSSGQYVSGQSNFGQQSYPAPAQTVSYGNTVTTQSTAGPNVKRISLNDVKYGSQF